MWQINLLEYRFALPTHWRTKYNNSDEEDGEDGEIFFHGASIVFARPGYASPSLLNGKSRTRFPGAAKTALHNAGVKGGTPGSPMPAGGASLSTRCTYVSRGADFIRAIGYPSKFD